MQPHAFHVSDNVQGKERVSNNLLLVMCYLSSEPNVKSATPIYFLSNDTDLKANTLTPSPKDFSLIKCIIPLWAEM